MRSKTLLAVGAALALMFLAQPLLGATVEVGTTEYGGPALIYRAAVGEINTVSIIESASNAYLISDLTATITPGATSCVSISPTAVRCEVVVDQVEVSTIDGADSVEVISARAVVRGGAGPDTLTATRDATLFGGGGDDWLVGRSGEQELEGGNGADLLDGGLDRDWLVGGAGTDVIAGGPSLDIVSYADHRGSVRISLDGRANDGAAGENDWVQADVEGVDGSRGPTTFVGNAGPNGFSGYGKRDVASAGAGDDSVAGGGGPDLLSGGPGDDGIYGGAGADVIRGGRWNDFLDGNEGADDLGGGRGRDYLFGGYGPDTLRGGPGRDRLLGNEGADVLSSRDRSRDRVSGGAGHDRAHVDRIDALWSIEALF